MPVPELDLLKPIDPSITNSDDYEIFVLSNAHVAYESNGKLANLLSAYADTPLKVEGRLEPPARGQAKHYLKKPYKPVDVEVRHVTRFSYGQMTDGESIIWAQGRSGWFEIRPARNYKSIYNDMVEAVDLLYFVTDIYNEPKKRGAGPGAQLVFQEYAEDERFACTDAEAAAQVFHKHRMFLMMCFLNRAQGIGWSSSALYQYFRRHYPKDFDACKARVDGRCPEILPPQPQRASRSSKVSPTRSAAPTPTTTSFKPRTTRMTAAAYKQQEQHPKKNDNWWEAAALFEFMQKAVNQRILRPGHNHITLDQIAKLIVKRYEIDELETARNVLLVHASNLCYMMDHPRRQSIRFFAEEPIYNELEAGHSLSAIEQKRAESVELKPRRDRTSLREDHSNSSDTSMDDNEEEERKGKAEVFKTPVRRLPGRRRKGARLSILRPKSGKFSGKGKGVSAVSGKGKRPIPDLSTSGDSDDERGEQSSDDDEMGVDTPTQALSPGREKRKFIETDSDEEGEKGRRKRAASTSANLDSPPTTTETDEDEDQEEEDTPEENGDDETLPLRLHPTHQPSQEPDNTTSSLSPTIISTPLPTYEANGPRDSWICTFDGCSQRIYGASKEHGRRLITEHLEDHARGREKFVGILWREREKLNLPVSNLIKKIRDMSEASTSLFPESSSLGAAAAALRPQPSLIRRPT